MSGSPRTIPDAVSSHGVAAWRPDQVSPRRPPVWQSRLFGIMLVSATFFAVLYLLVLVWVRPAPMLHVDVLAIGSYADPQVPPNPGAVVDLQMLQEGMEQRLRPAQLRMRREFGGVDTWLQELTDVPAGHHLLVYVNLHAIATKDQELVLKGHHEDVPFRRLLSSLEDCPARRTLLLMDVNRLSPSQRMGALAGDIPQYVKIACDQHLQELRQPSRVVVIQSCQAFERSWCHPVTHQSLFAQALADGLVHGAADGFLGSGSSNRVPNGVVDGEELFDFLRTQVEQQSREMSGASQTVVCVSDQKLLRQFPLVYRPKAPSPAVAARISPPLSLPSEVDRTKSVVKSLATEKTATSKVSSPASPTAAVTTEVNHAPQLITLADAWNRLDKLRPRVTDRPDGLFPFSQAQWFLWRAATLEAAGFTSDRPSPEQQASSPPAPEHASGNARVTGEKDDPLQIALQEVQRRLTECENALERKSTQGEIAWWRPNVPVIPNDEQKNAFTALLNAPLPAASPEGSPPPAEPLPRIRPQDRPIFVELLSKQLEGVERDQVSKVVALAAQLGNDGALPPELDLLRSIEMPATTLANPETVRKIAERHRTVREMAGRHGDALIAGQEHAAEALRSLDAAERWLAANASATQVSTWLDRANKAVQHLQAEDSRIRRMDQVLVPLMLSLPHWARWAALEVELDANVHHRLPPFSSNPAFKLLSDLIDDAAALQVDVSEPSQWGSVEARIGSIEDRLKEWDKFWIRRRSDLLNRRKLTAQELLLVAEIATSPLLTLDEHSRFQQQLAKAAGDRPPSAKEIPQAVRGLGQAYWSARILSLAGSAWHPFEDEKDGAAKWLRSEISDLNTYELRARFGARVGEEWNGLRPQTDSRLATYCLCIDFANTAADAWNKKTQNASDRRQKAWHQLLADDLNRRAGQGTAAASKHRQDILTELRQSDRTLEGSIAKIPDWELNRNDQLTLDSEGHGEIEIGCSSPGQELNLWFQESSLQIDGPSGRNSLQKLASDSKLKLAVHADPEIGIPKSLQFALLSNDGFPVSFRRLRLARAPDPQAWKIEFVAGDETGRPLHREESSGYSHFFIPPNSKTLPLRAVLVRPKNDEARRGTLIVYRRPTVKERYEGRLREELARIEDLELPGGMDRIRLDGLNLPVPAAGSPLKDLSGGLDVELKFASNDAKPFLWTLLPKYWSARELIQDLKPTDVSFDGTSFSVSVKRNDQSRFSSEFPREFPVSLSAPGIPDSNARDLGGETTLLRVNSLPIKLFVDGPFNGTSQISLNVANIPHAFRWQIPWGRSDESPVRLSDDDKTRAVRIDAPVSGTVIQAVDVKGGVSSINVRVQVNHADLDRSRESIDDSSWVVRLERIQELPAGAPPAKPQLICEWPLSSSYERSVQLVSLQAGVWTLQTATNDFNHTWTINNQTLNGRMNLRASLWENRSRIKHAADFVQIAIPRPSSSTELSIDAQVSKHPRTQPLNVVVSHRDSAVGIAQVGLYRDLNANGTLEESERGDGKELIPLQRYPVFDASVRQWIDHPETKFLLKPSIWEELKGNELSLIALAINAAGQSQTSKSVRIELTQPQKPATTAAKTTGTLKVVCNYRGEKKLSVDGKERTFSGTSESLELSPGTYDVRLSGYGLKVPAQKATVEAGKTVTLTFQ